MFDPYLKYDNDKFTTPILGDLYEIHYDLRKNWIAYEQGTRELVHEAIYAWKFDFEYHWGARLVSVLNPIHWLITDPSLGIKPEEEYQEDEDEDE